MSILITLCARGGSKGIPGKNIALIGGKPLLAYSLECANAFASRHASVITLSTDDDAIREVAANCGLKTEYVRPAFLATDHAGKIEVINHLLAFEERRFQTRYDYIIDLDISSPLRSVADVEASFGILSGDANALNLFSVNRANRNPYFNMVEVQSDGYYGLVKKGNFLSRQEAPEVYELNASIYVYRRTFFDRDKKPTISERSLIYVMPHICFDLDEPLDLEFMRFLVENKKIDFLV